MKRLVGTVVGAGVLLVSVAACGQSQDTVGFGGQPSVTSSSSTPTSTGGQGNGQFQPAPPTGGSAVPADKIDAAKLARDEPRVVWTVGDGRSVGVYGKEGGCSKVHVEVAEQDSSSVRLMLVLETPATAKRCTMDLRYPPLTVRLDAPLAARSVVLEEKTVQVPDK